MKPADVAGHYTKMATDRQPFLERGQEASSLTIPTLLPPDGMSASTKLPTPYQGLGARGLRNISSRLLMSLFPPNSPMARYVLDDFVVEQLAGTVKAKTEVDTALVKMENALVSEMERRHVRIAAFESLQHLSCAGNALLFMPEGEDVPRVFGLANYVVERDGQGNVEKIITKEMVSPDLLPPAALQALQSRDDHEYLGTASKDVPVYTAVFRTDEQQENKEFRSYQVVGDMMLPGSAGEWPAKSLPWLALRFMRISGESYGRGLVEEYLGDLRSLEALQQAAVEGAAAASKMLFLVDPGATTKLKDLAQAPNGAIRSGRAEDVTVVQADKARDFQMAGAVMQRIEERLSFAFLLNSAVQRSGERVTAEEIRFMANELENTLGGAYSLLALEMQLPIVRVLERVMQEEDRFPEIPEKIARPSIVTGLEALGRGVDFTRINTFMSAAVQAIGPDALAQYAKPRDILEQLANASGLDASTLIKTEEEIQAEMQQAQQQQMIEQFGNQAVDIAAQQAQQGAA